MGEVVENVAPAVADEAALAIFQNQWELYQKFLQHDYLANGTACTVLRSFLERDIARPFSILDLACGDASNIVRALSAVPVQRYRGVDLSAPALAVAARNLEALSCPVELDEVDFTTALRGSRDRADIVWLSLSLHHFELADKATFMREVKSGISDEGAFLIYEPTRRNGESRDQYIDRFEVIGRREWTGLTREEFAAALDHVSSCDLPETVATWHDLGRAAGFSEVRELYKSPCDMFRLFLYRP